MRLRIAHILFGCTAAASTLVAQTGTGEIRVTPVSEFRPDWLNEGVVSPNGRFFIVASYANDGFLRYDRVTKQWASPPGATVGQFLRWSPNGRFLAFVRQSESQEGNVWVLPLDTATALPNGTARRVSTRSAVTPAFSPDSRRIAFATNDAGRLRIVVIPFNGGDEQVLFDGPGRGGAVDWSPDGKTVIAAYAEPGKPPRRVRVDVQTKRTAFFVVTGAPRVPLSPDGARYADYDATSSRLYVTSAEGQRLQSLVLGTRIQPFAWSRSAPNELLALEHVVPTTVQRVSITGGPTQSIAPVDSAPIGGVQIAPDGRLFAFARALRGSSGLHVANLDGGNLRRIGAPADIGTIAWSPSSRRIAYITTSPSSSIRVVDASGTADRQVVAPPVGAATLGTALAWRRDELAVRYISRPGGITTTTREAREVGLDGKDRLLTKIEAPATATATFVNDTLLVLRHRETGIQAVDLRTGATRELYKGHVNAFDELGVSGDGNWIAFVTDENDKYVPRVRSLSTGETRSIAYTLAGYLTTLRFHPDGRTLVASACLTCIPPSYVEKWDIVVIPMNGDPPRVLTAGQPTYKDHGAPSVSPDGKTVLFEAEQSYNTRLVTLTLPKP